MAREMKYSGIEWIGQIPNSWGINKIKHNFSIVSGATPKSENADYWDGDILWITPADFKTQDKYVVRGKRNISQAGYDSCGTTLVPENSVIFSKRAPVGTVAIAKTALCTNQGCLSCIPKKKTSSLFYYYAMSIFTEQFELVSTGTTFKEIAATVFSDFYLPHPSIEEQQRIATFLDSECSRIDSVIEQTRASIEEYKKLKQAVITQAVTKGIHSDVSMKDSGIEWLGDIPADWSIQKTKSLSNKIVVGVVIKPADYFNEEGTVPFLRGINVKEYTIHPKPMVYIDEETNKLLSKSIVHKNDLLIVRDGSIGTTCVVPAYFDGANVVSMIIVTCCAEVSSEYLCYSFNSDVGKIQFNMTKIGTALTHTSVHSVSNIFHVMPTYKEQLEIVEYLEMEVKKIDSLIDKKSSLLSELESYKKSLIFEYVTGKKEVPA